MLLFFFGSPHVDQVSDVREKKGVFQKRVVIIKYSFEIILVGGTGQCRHYFRTMEAEPAKKVESPDERFFFFKTNCLTHGTTLTVQ